MFLTATPCSTCEMLRRLLVLSVATLAFVAIFLAAAAAQTTTAPTTTVSLWDALGPWASSIAAALAAVIIAFLGWVTETIRQKTGIQIDVLRSETLQAAITNGAGKAVVLLGDRLKTVTIDVRSPVVKEAVDYVLRSAPEAVKHFGLSPDQLAEKIIAKLGVITASNPEVNPVATPTPPVAGI